MESELQDGNGLRVPKGASLPRRIAYSESLIDIAEVDVLRANLTAVSWDVEVAGG
jgi:hypothetical protein